MEDVKKVLKKEKLAPKNIVLELTESYMVRNMDLLEQFLSSFANWDLKLQWMILERGMPHWKF